MPLLRADFMLLETVLVNLLDNAIKHGEGAQYVWASVKVQDGTIAFEVVDDGVGIPPDFLDRLFDRFFRVQRGDSKPAGSGLGLSICKGFVEAMGGKIEVKSPVHKAAAPPSSSAFRSSRSPRNRTPKRSAVMSERKPRILVIDDEPQILRFLRTSLSGQRL